MKLIVDINSLEILDECLDNIDVVVVGYVDLAYDSGMIVEFDELVSLCDKVHQAGKEVWVNARRIVHEDDVLLINQRISEVLNTLVDGIMYTDLFFYMALENTSLLKVFTPTTYVTSKYDLEVLKKKHDIVLASPEVSIDELEQMASMNSICYLFGQMSIFHSRRKLLTNYFEYRLWMYDSDKKYLLKEELREDYLPIKETKLGTSIYLEGFYSSINYVNRLQKFEFGLISGLFLTPSELVSVINAYVRSDESLIDVKLVRGALDNKTILLKGDD